MPRDRIGGMADGPKSAYELAMERLRQKDREAGVEERPLTDQQKAAIAQARRVYLAAIRAHPSVTDPDQTFPYRDERMPSRGARQVTTAPRIGRV